MDTTATSAAPQLKDSVREVLEGIASHMGVAETKLAREIFYNRDKAIKKAQQAADEAQAAKLCRALRPGDKVLIDDHGDCYFEPRISMVFYKPEATVYCYQPRKKLLWLTLTTTKGREVQKGFSLLSVKRYHVRRATE